MYMLDEAEGVVEVAEVAAEVEAVVGIMVVEHNTG